MVMDKDYTENLEKKKKKEYVLVPKRALITREDPEHLDSQRVQGVCRCSD